VNSPMTNFAEMAAALEATGDYRVLRRLMPRDRFVEVPAEEPLKIGIALDLETTGLDTMRDEVIEIGMVKFAYTKDGRVTHVIDTFSAFNEPSTPIPAQISELTGITDAMVAGHRIDPAAVAAFIGDAVLVIAHNASFDRQFSERYWPEFEAKAWACTATQIPWRLHGFEGAKLTYLLAGAGLFHGAHRAVDDCRAVLELLALELTGTDCTALSRLLEGARRKTTRIWAEGSPFELRNELKKRGYRWNDGSNGNPKSWFVDLEEAQRSEEIAFLRTQIYCADVTPNTREIDAYVRFSNRV
jgi:DNA polymerase III subunit epsilon